MIHKAKTLLWMTLSCFLCSAAVNWVAIPNGFTVTGITGITMVIEKLTGLNYALAYYLISFIIVIVTFFVLGAGELKCILFLSVLYPAVLWGMNHFSVSIILQEKLIALALFAVLYGGGAGIVLRIGYSYGGMDTISKILKKSFFPTWEIRSIMLFADSGIMLLMLTVFSLDSVAYAFVGQLIAVNSMNYVLFNMGPKLYEVQVISNHSKELEQFVIETIHKSLTLHPVKGGYSGENKLQMDCVCTSKEYARLREFLLKTDKSCFIKVIPLVHVFGTNKDFRRLDDDTI